MKRLLCFLLLTLPLAAQIVTGGGGAGGGLVIATFASPPASPTVNQPFLFIDAASTGACTGGGSSYAVCAWTGSAWAPSAGTSTGTGLGDPGSNSVVYRNGTGTSIPATATQMSGPNFCADAGSTDTYACNLAPAIASYQTGTLYWFQANTANTGAATINLNAKGALTLVKMLGSITTGMVTGDINAGQWVAFVYDGTNAQVANQLGTTVDTTSTQIITGKTVDGVTPTIFGYLDATSSIQTQLNAKQATFTGTCGVNNLALGNSTCLTSANNAVLVSGSAGALSLSATLPSNLTIPGYQLTSAKDSANGYAGLTAGSLLQIAECPVGSGSQAGCIASADWTTFNGKQAALGYTPPNPANNLAEYTATASSVRVNIGFGGFNGIRRANGSAADTLAVAGTDYQAPLGFTAENIANKDAASGYAGLTAGSLLKAAELPFPATAALGGVFSKDCSATPGQMLQKINTDGSETCTAPFYWLVGSGGTSQTQRHRTNFIQGSNVTLTITDNSGTDSTDVAIASTGGGGGGGGNYQTVESVGSALTQRATLNFGVEFATVDNSGAARTDVSVNSIANTKITGLGTSSTHAATDFALAFTGTCSASHLVAGDSSCLATINSGVVVTGGSGVPSVSTTLPAGLTIPGYQASLTLPLSAANGGSGAANTPGAAGHVLRSNGSVYVDSAIQAADVPTLNQNTTGTAASATTATTSTNIAGGVTGSLPYQNGSGTTALLAGNTAATDQVLVSHGTGSAAQAPTLSNAPALSAANMTAFPTLNQSTTGNSATATALASTPVLCLIAGQVPTGVLANGNATGCAALLASQVTNAFSTAAANSLGAFAETMTDITTPANPSAGATKFYSKAGALCSLSPAGAETCTGSSPLTTKGDLLGFSTLLVRVPIGSTNGFVLTQDSTAAAGFSWQAGGTNVAFQQSGALVANSTTFNFVPGSGIVGGFSNVGGVATLTPSFNTALIPTHDTIHANENFPTLTSTGVTALTYTSADKTIAACTAGMTYQFYTDTANPVSISIDSGCSTKSIKSYDGSTSLSSGTITAASYFTAIFDGTVFRYMGGGASGGSMTWPAAAGLMVYAGGSAYGTSITTSAGLAGAISDEIGSGFLLFSTNGVLTTPALATGSSPLGIIWTVGTGGVTANTLVQADASTPAKIVASTSGTVGVAMTTVAAAGTVSVAEVGIVNCVTDTGGATAGDLVIQGTGTVIDCKDSGVTTGASIPITTRIIGIFRSTASAGASALVQLSPNRFGTQLFGGNTLTLAGNLTTTGAFNTTFAQAASTTVTLPSTSSTMARTDAAQTFTGIQTFSTPIALTSIATTVVNATSPSAGIAHFAGSTQTVTSSAVSLTADVTGLLPAANLPNAGVFTGFVTSTFPAITVSAHNIVGPLTCADTSGSGTVQSCTTSPSFTPIAGDAIIYTTTTANTAGIGLTVNVNSLGAKAVQKFLGSGNPSVGDVAANIPVLMIYDGTHWQLSTTGTYNFGVTSVTSLSTAGQITSTASTGTAPFVVSSTTQVANLNAATAGLATYLAGGAAGSLPYQSAAATTAFLASTGYSVLVTGATNPQYATPTANGQCFMSGAASYATTIPSFQTCPAGGGMSIGGTVTSGTTNNLLYVASGPVLGQIAAVNSAVLSTNGSGVPSESTTLPSGLAATNLALTTPTLGVAAGTSLALGGCTIGTDKLCVTGTSTFNNGVVFGGSAPATFNGTVTLNGLTTISGNSLVFSGSGVTASAWTTNGVLIKAAPQTMTDTSSSGTVAAAYTNVFGGDTIAASSAAVYTNYYETYFKAEVAGTNVTLTNTWAFGADSLHVGTSNAFIVGTTGHVTTEGVTSTGATGTGAFVFATSASLVTPALGVATATSLAIGGAAIGSNGLAVTGTANISGALTVGSCTGCGTAGVTSVTFTGDGTVLSSTPSSAVTTTGTVTAALANAGAGTILGNITGSSAAPGYTAAPLLGLPGTTAGTLGLSNSAAAFSTTLSSGATANNTVKFFATAPVTGDLVDCVTASVTCTMTDSGVLAANVVTTGSNFAANQVLVGNGANKIVALASLFISGSPPLIFANSNGASTISLTAGDAATNTTLALTTIRGSNQTASGGGSSSARGGSLALLGGNVSTPNTSTVAGGVYLMAGLATNATQGLQGLMSIGSAYVKGTTVTQWNVQDLSGAKTVTDCATTSTAWIGVAEVVNTNTVQVLTVDGTETFVNATAAVTVNHTVCTGSTVGQVTDSGGIGLCTLGEEVGRVEAIAGTWTLGDGTTATATSTLPLIILHHQ
jgi:hypothetical protein